MSAIGAWPPVRYHIALPARDEAAYLCQLLDALVAQDVAGPIGLSICLNNTTDRSAALIDEHAGIVSGRLKADVIIRDFPPSTAHAGSARRCAMAAAANQLGLDPDALIISTDADTRPPINWISAMLTQARGGADIIGGRLDIDGEADLPPAVMRLHLAWAEYWRLVRAIEDAIDPRPWDLPPRHGDHTGASLAIRLGLYLAVGGVPAIALGEDRALVAAACAAGGRLVHPQTVFTLVSPRRVGRAVGGMAASMDVLYRSAAAGTDPLVPGLDHWRARAHWRRDLRIKAGDAAIPLAEDELPAMPDDTPLCTAIATP